MIKRFIKKLIDVKSKILIKDIFCSGTVEILLIKLSLLIEKTSKCLFMFQMKLIDLG